MEFRENPIFGRKVFFINPPFVVEKHIIEWLKELEYDIYIIKNYQHAKAVLRRYENAICFINIDEQLSLKGWYNFIKSFESDLGLKSVFLGIMAARVGTTEVNKFLMNLKLPGGYISLNVMAEELMEKFHGILQLNGAKGRRKYLRLDCDHLDTVNGYVAYGNKLYNMTVENISSIGISCSFDKDIAFVFAKNTVLNNVSLSLGRWSVITQSVVFEVKTMNNKNIAILLFIKETPKEIKTSIRRFIYDVMTKRLDEFVASSVLDLENYNVSKKSESDNAIPDYDAPTDADAVAEADVEELDETEGSQETENTASESKETSAVADADSQKGDDVPAASPEA